MTTAPVYSLAREIFLHSLSRQLGEASEVLRDRAHLSFRAAEAFERYAEEVRAAAGPPPRPPPTT